MIRSTFPNLSHPYKVHELFYDQSVLQSNTVGKLYSISLLENVLVCIWVERALKSQRVKKPF